MQSCGYAVSSLGAEHNIIKNGAFGIAVKYGTLILNQTKVDYTIQVPDGTTKTKIKKKKKKEDQEFPSLIKATDLSQKILCIPEIVNPVHMYVKTSVKQNIFALGFDDYHIDIWVDQADIPEEDKPDKGQGAIKGVIFTIQKNTYTEISLEFLEDGYTVNQVAGLPNGLTFKNGVVRGSLTNSGIYEFVIIGSNSENQQVELQCKIEVPQLIRLL